MHLDPKKDYGFTVEGISDTQALPAWDAFRLKKIREIFLTSQRIIDFGNASRGLAELFADDLKGKEKIGVDIDQDTKPDVVADICDLKIFGDASIDGIICVSILEHVYDPFQACREMRRILKPGGKLFLYVPWMWRYHAPDDGAYKDYFRFSRDGVRELLKGFSDVEIVPVRGRIEAVMNLAPRIGKRSLFYRLFGGLVRRLDRYDDKNPSGFNVYAAKG
ncbi:MAG: class I SAM-dependent methyltransferase [Patescibacteria group bacterium]